MNVRSDSSGRLPADKGSSGLALGSRRSLALLGAIVVTGLGIGLLSGLLLKAGKQGNPAPLSSTAASRSGEPIPAVPALQTIGTLPALRVEPRRHTSPNSSATANSSSSSGASAGSPSGSSPSSVTTPATHPTLIPNSSGPTVSSQPASPSPSPKQAPSHSESGEVHHESGGGA
jgi:hypothetical protein